MVIDELRVMSPEQFDSMLSDMLWDGKLTEIYHMADAVGDYLGYRHLSSCHVYSRKPQLPDKPDADRLYLFGWQIHMATCDVAERWES